MYNICYSHKDNVDIAENKAIVEIQSIDYQNKKRPVNQHDLLIDTGAFINMLNKATAEERGYSITDVKGCAISGFSQNALLCDLRIIPAVIFCGYVINDVIVATPHFDNVAVSEVLGMNVLENFDFGLNLTNGEIYICKRASFVSEKPKYRSGEVNLLSDISLDKRC